MKKLLIAIAVVGLMYSCGGSSQKPQEEPKADSTLIADTHNARTSLDYMGSYTGKLPTASGEGMNVTIELGDSTFVKKTQYVGKKETFEEKGKYSWNNEGNTVILEGIKDAPSKYFVGENTLTQLDMEGKKITGDIAELYILKKQ
ncbi:copper resistance protein NlpE N-terminal domain-containing protein [Dysgonomonas mossii]|uniref:Copper resistance protein NlpE n=2 Tax=Dysgonomonas TaxID=156973 RepID=A0A4Y9IM28_9BACT|nr:copper resistance protein NlpE [Dysgonomonas mossii]MBF0760629.1 copper resistance protein NlpE N-terminal domain-containing protein [Dysgonomonas mossii]TFU89597.1 copper resistance protein NlpE [Dysgonomonas mossii]